uniref:Uncharacterized protein n=1 Tax=Spumella elongata TaxID=89044 RepID=A0A7S3HEW3_9STRA|mmetsp:Transcript_49355/g.86245  ORF Transcript_49355/g.86245 Transcript_49355/m.86245 type:complete len:399 (+) Transcript_49355:71-1267(+)
MMASVEGCIVETCADSTKQPKVECGMFVGLSIFSTGGNESKMSSCKLPDAPQDVSPKSVSSFTDTLSMMETIPVVKSHKRQRSDAMVENSPALDSFLARQNSSVVDSQRAGPLVDTAEDMCKPRAVYPVNFKAPKMYSSPQSGRSRDLEIPLGGGSSAGEWSQLRSPSDPSFLSNFNIGFFNKGNFPTNNNVSDHRRLSRQRSRANSRNNSSFNNGATYEQVDAPSEDADHSQISIDLERISLAATSFSPFTSPRPTLRPSPLLPVVFSPIQPVAYRSFVTGMIEGTSAIKEEEEEDQELVINLPTEERHASIGGAVPSLNSHTHHHHHQQQEHYLHKPNHYHSHPPSSVHIVTLPNHKITPPPTYEAAYTHGMRADPMVVEASEPLDEDMLIFNMDA